MEIKLGLSVARAALVTVVTTAVLVGCSNGQLGGAGGSGSSTGVGTGGIGGTGGAEPLEMFASDFETTFCAPRVKCGVYPDLATCEALVVFSDGYDLRNIIASARRGTVAYDPVAAAACIAALPQDCSATQSDQEGYPQAAAEWALQYIGACISTFTGTVPLGGACRTQDFECTVPSVCYGGACTGTCIAVGVPDAGSPQIAIPASGHVASCDPTSSAYACGYLDDYCGVPAGAATAVCLPRLPPGSPCSLADLGTFSYGNTNVDPCQQQAQCVGGVCVSYTPLGGACGDGVGQCLGGLPCTSGTCVAFTPPADSCTIPM
jgi:hypothetical protein